MDDQGKGVVGGGVGLSFSFDETTGSFGVKIPFKRKVHTRISLLAIKRP
jgi:hypothetical protein